VAETPADLLRDARKTVVEISAEEVKSKLDSGEIDLLVDVREPAEWDAGHIPGALHVPRGLIEWYADPLYANHKSQLAQARDKHVVLQCGHGMRSLLAAQSLQRLGFVNVKSMAGGFADWSAKGLPVENQRPVHQKGALVAEVPRTR
jgi:rhodanese-related sulfurtransferase